MNGHDYALSSNAKDLNSVNSLLGNQAVNLADTKDFINKLRISVASFERQQACLREDLKLTTNYAHVENRKLQDELNTCRYLYMKNKLLKVTLHFLDYICDFWNIYFIKN